MGLHLGPRTHGKISAPDENWLARAPLEAVLEPDLPIIDPHHHLWDEPTFPYLVRDFANEICDSGHNLRATIYANNWIAYRADGPEEFKPVGEIEFANGLAALSASGAYGPARIAAGIIGSLDVRLGARARPVLEAMIQAGGGPGGRFKGIRVAAGWTDDPAIAVPGGAPGLYRDPTVRAAIGVLADLGLTLDAQLFHPQLLDLVSLAHEFPGLTIVLNHCGQPLGYGNYADRDASFRAWLPAIREVARCHNVSIKLGGLMLRLAVPDHVNPPAVPPDSAQFADLWRPWLEICIDAFGPARCMFESNFPVEKMGVSYRTIWNAFKRIAAGATEAEKHALFFATAQRAYRLSAIAPTQ